MPGGPLEYKFHVPTFNAKAFWREFRDFSRRFAWSLLMLLLFVLWKIKFGVVVLVAMWLAVNTILNSLQVCHPWQVAQHEPFSIVSLT